MKRSTGLLGCGWPVVAVLALLAGATLGLLLGDQSNAARLQLSITAAAPQPADARLASSPAASSPQMLSTPAPETQQTPSASIAGFRTSDAGFLATAARQPADPQGAQDCSDAYEPDDTPANAVALPLNGASQNHRFYVTGDEDWFYFQATAGVVYTATTSNLLSVIDPNGGIARTDTVMILYDSDTTSEVTRNDDYLPNSLASRLVWTATHTGLFYIKVMDFYGRGLCLGYTINASHGPAHLLLPVLMLQPTWTSSPTATPTRTETPTRTPTPIASPTPTPSPGPSPTATPTSYPLPIVIDVPVPGLLHPNAVAVDPNTHRVYVTSRDNNMLFMLDGRSFAVLGQATVCASPWGIAVNPRTGKLYVSCFKSGDILVMDAATLSVQADILLGAGPDWELAMMAIDPSQGAVFVASHTRGALVIVHEGATSYQLADANGAGTWGVAADPVLKRVYVSNRDKVNVSTLDATSGYSYLAGLNIYPCQGSGSIPYGLGFNAANSKLYVACSVNGSVNRLAVYAAGAESLQYLTTIAIGNGGANGGGGIAINPLTNHVLVTNSAANTVSIVDGNANKRLMDVPVGSDPFGIAVDPSSGIVYVADRGDGDLHVFVDPSIP